MEHSSVTNRKNINNSILDNYYYNSNQQQNQNKFQLMEEKNSFNRIKITENNEYSNGLRKNNIYLNNNNIISNYSKNINNNINNSKHSFVSNSLKPYNFINNKYNHENNNGGSIFNSHLNNNIYFVSGKTTNHSIKYITYSNNSLSKKDSQKLSNVAKTMKSINNNHENNLVNRNKYKFNQTVIKNDYSSDKIKSNLDFISFKNNNCKYKIKSDIKKGIIQETNNEINTTKKKDITPYNYLKDKLMEEENRSKTPLIINPRYMRNNIKLIISERDFEENILNGGENNIKSFSPKDEWNSKIKKKQINKENSLSNEIQSKNIKELDFSDKNIQRKNINNKNIINNENKENNNNNYRNKNDNKGYTIINFNNKNNIYTKLSMEFTSPNEEQKTLKTLKSTEDIFNNKNHNFQCTKKEKILIEKDNKTSDNNYEYNNINNLNAPCLINSKNNQEKIVKISNDLMNDSNKAEIKDKKTNITTSISQNFKQQIEINNKNDEKFNYNMEKINQIKKQNNIKKNDNTKDNNILKINGIENNNINNKNFIIIKQNENYKIFKKKLNHSPHEFKKITKVYSPLYNIELEQINNINKLTKDKYQEINLNYINTKKIENIKLKTENYINIDNNISQDKIKNENNINSFKKLNPQNGSNKNVYIKHKILKKMPAQRIINKGKLEANKVNDLKKDKISPKENTNNYSIDKIKMKVNIKNNRIKKYFNFQIKYPKINKCFLYKSSIKTIKIPKIELCKITKINSIIFNPNKKKKICYYSKIRLQKIKKPPVNEICEWSKNIILIPPNKEIQIINEEKKVEKNEENINENQNKSPVISIKKNKKRKKRRKTRRIHNGKETNPTLISNKNEKIDYINQEENNNKDEVNENSLKKSEEEDNKSISKEEKEKKNNNNEYNNYDNINENITKEVEKISLINSNSLININNILEDKKINNIQNIINDKSSIFKSSNEEKSLFSEKEMYIGDIEKNNYIKKKLSPTSYNEEDYNDEENEDFRIVSDEEDLSEDKFKKKEFRKENKTEGKEISGDYNINKNNNGITDIEKKAKGFKLLEKLQDKRNSNKDQNYLFSNENVRYNDINNYEEINQNIVFGTDKLNKILKKSKNQRYSNDIYHKEETENDYFNNNSNMNYSNDEKNDRIQKENENDKSSNQDFNIKKNNTFKKNVDYEKITSIFDKLEGIIEKKNINNNEYFENGQELQKEKYHTPPLIKKSESLQEDNFINNFDLKEEDYIYRTNKNGQNNYTDNITEDFNENESYNYIENEINTENMDDNIENNKNFDMNKYKEIFNKKEQIISKLESLIIKQKNNINSFNSFQKNNYGFNSPKIESEIDSDMNINKDTPGNRKEIKYNKFFANQNNINDKKKYTIEEILSYKNNIICLNTNLLPSKLINHCNEISKTIQDQYSSIKNNYKDIVINKNDNYAIKGDFIKKEKEKITMEKWARKDMTKEIEKAEKYVKELNKKMSKDNFKYEIIEILNTLTVDNYKNILKKIIEMIYLIKNPNNNKLELNKSEYLLHNQIIFVEIIIDKATIEKGYVILYAKLCADLFIEFIKLIKEYNNPELEKQLINGENLKTILTTECRQRFDECTSISTTSKNLNEEEKNEFFLIFKKKFLGNMNFIAELINVKILSQTKGFEFLDILYKRYKEIKNNDKIKFLNLEGAITLLTKFGKIVMERQNPKHIQNLDNYIKDNIIPTIPNNNNKNKNLPNYLKFKIINLIEKKKNNWKDSLYEQSIIAKGKNNNNNISLYHDCTDSNINIDESLIDCQKANNNQDKEENIIILLKNDIENYSSFLNEHDIFNKNDIIEYNKKNESNDINNEYDWSISEELINKAKNELEEIIRCYIEVCIDYVTKKNNIFYCNEYIKNLINYYSVDLTKNEKEKFNYSINDLYLNIEDITIDNFFMLEIMGYLMLILIDNNLFYIEDIDKFINEDKSKIIKISQVIKFSIVYSDGKRNEIYEKYKNIKLFTENKKIFDDYVVAPLKNDYNFILK